MLSKVCEVLSRLGVRKSVIKGPSIIIFSHSDKFEFVIKSNQIFRKYDIMTSNWVDMGSSLTPNDVIAR